MSNVIRSLVVKIGADVSGFSNATKYLSKDLKALSKSTGKIGASLTNSITKPVMAGMAGLGAVILSGIQDAAEAEKGLAQLDAVLKSTGGAAGVTKDQVLELANAFQKTTPFEDDVTLAAENMLLTFTNIGKEVFPDATKTVLDMATALGQDATQSAMQLGKAINDPIRGMASLRRVGVTFTDDQEKLITKLQESGDIMGAQKVILQELQKEFGGSAEAAGKTFAGQLEILKNSFGDVKEEIGMQMMPVLQEAMAYAQNHMPEIQQGLSNAVKFFKEDMIPVIKELAKMVGGVVDWFSRLSPKTQENIGKFILLGAALGPVLTGISTILSIGSSVSGILSGIGTAAGTAAGTSGAAGAAGGVAGFGAALGALIGPAGVITLVLVELWALKEAFDAVRSGEVDLTKAYGTKGPRQQWQFGNGGYEEPATTIIGKGGSRPSEQVNLEDVITMGNFKAYANGTNYVPETGLALIHKGEAVIPANKNNGANGITIAKLADQIIVREEADIDKIGNMLVKKLKLAGVKV